MQYKLSLQPGQPQRHEVGGNLFVLVTNGGASDLKVTIERNGQAVNEFNNVNRGLKFRAPQGFTSIRFEAAEVASIEFIVTSGDADVNLIDGATVNVGTLPPVIVGNGPAQPIPVLEQNWPDALKRGLKIENLAPVALTDVAALIVSAPAGAKVVRLRNVGEEAIAIGGPGVTTDNAVVVLIPGMVREETEAAGAEIWGVCGTNAGVGTSIVNVEVIQA